jgi:serine/threonine protein kinase
MCGGVCKHSEGFFIVTEYVKGGDVRGLMKKYIENPKGLSWQRRTRIAQDLAKVMLFLHSKGIIHRDLKVSAPLRPFALLRSCASR